jgi:hypothetical protein
MATGGPGLEPVEDGRRLQETEVLETKQGTFVVVAVGYQDGPDGEHLNFTYQIKNPEDILEEAPAPEEE